MSSIDQCVLDLTMTVLLGSKYLRKGWINLKMSFVISLPGDVRCHFMSRKTLEDGV